MLGSVNYFIVFARMKNARHITGLIVENDPQQWYYIRRGRAINWEFAPPSTKASFL